MVAETISDGHAHSHSPGRRSSGPGALAVWFQAIRAFSLTASATPVLIGTALAVRAGFFSGGRFILALVGALAIHIGTNLINDYWDHVKGVDFPGSTGSSRVIQEGLLTDQQVWWGGMAAFSFGSALGIVLVFLCGWPVLALGIGSVAAGYFYTADPLSLAYSALGDVTVFIFMGPVIVFGAYYVMTLQAAFAPLVASIPIGFLVTAILHANNIRDADTDKIHGKHTLANVIGQRPARLEFAALNIGAYAATVLGVIFGFLPWTTLATFITAGRARRVCQVVFDETDPQKLDSAVLQSAQLHMEFGLVFVTAIFAAAIFRW